MASKFETFNNNVRLRTKASILSLYRISIFVYRKVRPRILVSLADDQRQTGAIGTKVWNTNADESIVLKDDKNCIEDLLAHEYKPAPLIHIVRGRNESLLPRERIVSISHSLLYDYTKLKAAKSRTHDYPAGSAAQ